MFAAINMVLAFCMGTDIDNVLGSPIGQPMASIFFNSFGKKGTLAIWAVVVIVQYVLSPASSYVGMHNHLISFASRYMMGSSMVLAASRQSFAFSRDGALPFSKWLYRMNAYTGTPVNTVWFCAIWAIILGLLAFAGPSAINAVFSLGVTALYVGGS